MQTKNSVKTNTEKNNFLNKTDFLPYSVKNSPVLTRRDLEQLASFKDLPQIDPSFEDEKLKNIFEYYSVDPVEMENELHLYASDLISRGKLKEAWQVLLALI
jgi:hypothetical protein